MTTYFELTLLVYWTITSALWFELALADRLFGLIVKRNGFLKIHIMTNTTIHISTKSRYISSSTKKSKLRQKFDKNPIDYFDLNQFQKLFLISQKSTLPMRTTISWSATSRAEFRFWCCTRFFAHQIDVLIIMLIDRIDNRRCCFRNARTTRFQLLLHFIGPGRYG